jgi:outer membrane protein assembly factor BamB
MSLRPDKPLAVCIAQDDRGGQEKKVAWAVDAKTGERQWQRDDTESVITVGKKAVYLLADPKVAGGRKIVSVDALKGEELTSLPVDGFDIIPLNDADHGTNAKARGIIFLISRSGAMQAIQEKP